MTGERTKVEYPDRLKASSYSLLEFKPGKKDISYEGTLTDNAANAMLTRPFREKWLDINVVDWMNKYQNIYL